MSRIFELQRHLPAGQFSLVNDRIMDLAKSVEIQGFGGIKLNTLKRESIVRFLNSEFKGIFITSPGVLLAFWKFIK